METLLQSGGQKSSLFKLTTSPSLGKRGELDACYKLD
jgi:hypothetical protein